MKSVNKIHPIFILFMRKYARLVLLCFVLIGLSGYTIIRHYHAYNDGIVGKNYFTKRYIKYSANLDQNTDTDRLLALMDRGAAVGYNGIVLGDRGGQYNSARSQSYQNNAARVVAKGIALGMSIIPEHFGSNDPYYDAATKSTIEEALPVQGTRYQVDAGVDGSGNNTTTFAGDNGVNILNGNLENWTGNTPNNFWTDGAGTISFRDQTVAHSGSSSLRITDPINSSNGASRLVNTVYLTVKPNVSYTFSVWIKTQNLTNPEKLSFQPFGYPGGSNLFMAYTNPFQAQGIASTQNWKQYSIVLTTQDKTQLSLYLGLWSSTATGNLWIDDLSLTENGMAGNILNRTSLNPIVKSDDGLTTYTQTTDYLLNGSTITILPTSSVKAGDYIRVDWYQEPLGRDREASACYDQYYAYLKADGLRLQSYFGNPKGYMSDYDEWRTANWDPLCKTLNGGVDMTGGQYMAYAFQRTYNTIREVRADADIYVWNDMFDPYHNAVANYYSVNGSIVGSTSGVPSDVIIINWNTQQNIDTQTNISKMKSSLSFWSGRGNPQILSMSGLNATNNFLTGLGDLEASPGGINKVDGFMYTSWGTDSGGNSGDYTDLEAMADLIKADGRWGELNVNVNPVKAFTYKDKVTLSGTKSTDVVGIKVNGVDATLDNNANTWSIDVDLVAGQNTFNIIGKDQSNNSSITTTVNIIRRKLADANNDSVIDDFDFTLLLYNWGLIAPDNIADFNEDGKVDDLDFTILLYWMR